MTVSKERVTDKRPMYEGRSPYDGAPSEGVSSERPPNEAGAAHKGMSSEGMTASKPATTMKSAVKTAAAAKPRLRRRHYQCGE
jgi:hypothetical protein